jgi:hypothetical protein
MSEWQDISTAPKDGTKVLVGCFWVAEGYAQFLGHMAVDHWEDRFRGFGKFNSSYWPATHWQPLPPVLSKAKHTEAAE